MAEKRTRRKLQPRTEPTKKPASLAANFTSAAGVVASRASMRSAPAARLALLVTATVAILAAPALAGGGCMVVLDLPKYTLCGPAGDGGCGGAGGGEVGEDGGLEDASADH